MPLVLVHRSMFSPGEGVWKALREALPYLRGLEVDTKAEKKGTIRAQVWHIERDSALHNMSITASRPLPSRNRPNVSSSGAANETIPSAPDRQV